MAVISNTGIFKLVHYVIYLIKFYKEYVCKNKRLITDPSCVMRLCKIAYAFLFKKFDKLIWILEIFHFFKTSFQKGKDTVSQLRGDYWCYFNFYCYSQRKIKKMSAIPHSWTVFILMNIFWNFPKNTPANF